MPDAPTAPALPGDAWLEAWRFAAEAHQGQCWPGTELPYLTHLGMVAMELLQAHALQPVGDLDLALRCAILHDVVEDQGLSPEALSARFGPAVAAGVLALSKDPSLPKAEAMADSLRRIQAQPKEVWCVKLADRISNLQGPPPHWSLEKAAAYRVEAQGILAALGEAHPVLAARLAQKIALYGGGAF